MPDSFSPGKVRGQRTLQNHLLVFSIYLVNILVPLNSPWRHARCRFLWSKSYHSSCKSEAQYELERAVWDSEFTARIFSSWRLTKISSKYSLYVNHDTRRWFHPSFHSPTRLLRLPNTARYILPELGLSLSVSIWNSFEIQNPTAR